MTEPEWLAEQFEQNRGHLRAVAYRMLGSANEAEDAVQEAWLRLSRSEAGDIENLGAWLTTVVSRVCLDMLRSRTSRREDTLETQVIEPAAKHQRNPEQEALLADSVGLALLVVLDRLDPAERLALVLHDMFAVPFEEIAGILGRSVDAVRQLASRARRRVQGPPAEANANLTGKRKVVDAFLTALRNRDFEGIVAVLDPEVVIHVDGAAAASGKPIEVQGAQNWARGAIAFAAQAVSLRPALVNGEMGMILAPGGKLQRVVRLQFKDERIAQVEIVAEPARLAEFELGVLDASN